MRTNQSRGALGVAKAATFTSNLGLMLLVQLTAPGCDQVEVTEDARPSSQLILNAEFVPNPHYVVALSGLHACSGTLYKGDWVLTAAHCIPNWDANGSGRIRGSELAGRGAQILGGPDASGASTAIDIVEIYKHPESKFDSAERSDTALIRLKSSFDINWIRSNIDQAWKLYTHDGVLRLASSLTGLSGGQVLYTFGYSTVSLSTGHVSVLDTQGSEGWYTTIGTGASCKGDSGGPDIWFSVVDAWHVGIHSRGNCTATGPSFSIKSAYVKPWVESVAGK